MVRADVVVRRFTAALLDKGWLAGVKKGWASLLKPRITDWDDVRPAIGRLTEFVENMQAQIAFKRLIPDNLKGPVFEKFKLLRESLTKNLNMVETLRTGVMADDKLKYLQDDFSEGLTQFSMRAVNPEKAMAGILRDLQKIAALLAQAADQYPKETQEQFGGEVDSEFDLHGMRVVVDDQTVTPQQMDQYLDLMREAYSRMKAKKLDKAWTGTTFIQCADCGGKSEPGYQVGGHFRVGPNDVSIFTRPGPTVVHTLVHELGHRFWYKQMSKAQRDEFRDLVDVSAQHLDISQVEQYVTVRKSAMSKWTAAFMRCAVEEVNDKKTNVVKEAKVLPGNTAKILEAELASMEIENADDLLKGYLSAVAPQAKALKKAQEALDDAFPLELQTPEMREPYLQAINQAVEAWSRANTKALDQIILTFQATRPAPVSQYGRSHIDEAFAEAFAYYVLDRNMTRDQADSFKHVMRLASVEPPDLLLRQGVEFSE